MVVRPFVFDTGAFVSRGLPRNMVLGGPFRRGKRRGSELGVV